MSRFVIFGPLVIFALLNVADGAKLDSDYGYPPLDEMGGGAQLFFCKIVCFLSRNEESCYILKDGTTVTACVYHCLKMKPGSKDDGIACVCKNSSCITATTTTTTTSPTSVESSQQPQSGSEPSTVAKLVS